MAGDTSVTFAVKVPVETNAGTAASSVDELRAAIEKSQAAVKQYGNTLRNLRGSSNEVKAAKEKLKAGIEAERGAISRNTLALFNQGKALTDNKKKTDGSSNVSAKLRDVLKSAGGPVDSAVSKVESFTKALGGGSTAMGVMVGSLTLGVAGFVALGVGITAATVSLAKFILTQGNELRTAALHREAIVGSAADAKRMGDQIDLLATKVPTSRAELNKLYTDLRRNTDRTRISGQGILDVFNATAQVSAAMGDTAGKALEGILTRGKQLGRFQLSFGPGGIDELQGLGIASEDVAKQLAKNLKIGIDQARQELFLGRVKLDDGAKAVRDVVEARFGKVNAALMLDLNVQVQKFKDRLQGLVKGINLEKILQGFERLSALFDENTVTGQAIKKLLQEFTDVIGNAFINNIPFIEEFFTQMLIGAFNLKNSLVEVGTWLKKVFGEDFSKYSLAVGDAILIVKTAFYIFIPIIEATAVAVVALIESFKALWGDLHFVLDAVSDLWDGLNDLDWTEIGVNIVDGIVNGLKSGIGLLDDTVANMGEGIKKKFKALLGLGSPSKVFQDFGEWTAEGYSKGLSSGGISSGGATPSGVNVAIPSGGGKGGGGGSSGPVTVTLAPNFPGVKDADGVRQTLTSASFKAELTRAFEEIFTNAGTPTQTAQTGAL